jgi:hypothetical protein
MNDQAQWIANAQGVDLRQIPRPTDERIVRGSGPIVIEPQDLAARLGRLASS